MPIWRYVDDGDCIGVSDSESDDSSTSSRSVQSNGLRHAKLHFAALSLALVHFFRARRHPQAWRNRGTSDYNAAELGFWEGLCRCHWCMTQPLVHCWRLSHHDFPVSILRRPSGNTQWNQSSFDRAHRLLESQNTAAMAGKKTKRSVCNLSNLGSGAESPIIALQMMLRAAGRSDLLHHLPHTQKMEEWEVCLIMNHEFKPRSACDKATGPQTFIKSNFPDVKLDTHFYLEGRLFDSDSDGFSFWGCIMMCSSAKPSTSRVLFKSKCVCVLSMAFILGK